MKNQIKIGVLGAGAMGGTVIEHLQICPLVSEIIAQDIRPERVTDLATRYGIESTTEVRRILDAPRPAGPCALEQKIEVRQHAPQRQKSNGVERAC